MPPTLPPLPHACASDSRRESGLCVCVFASPCASVRPCASGLSASHTQTLSHTQTQARFHFPPRNGAAGPGMAAAVATTPPPCAHLCTNALMPAPAGATDGGAVSARVRGDGRRRPLRVQDDGRVRGKGAGAVPGNRPSREPECETDAQSHLMSEYNIRAPGNRGSLAQQLLECGPDSSAVLETTDG